MNPITEKSFNKVLHGLVRSATAQRDLAQILLVFGLEHYKQHENTVYLTRMLNACVGVKSLPTRTMKEFIQAHANVSWQKTTDGSMVFKKVGKEVQVTMPTTLWYDFSKDHQAQPDVNIVTRFNGFITALENAMKEGKIKEGQEAIALKISETLATLKPEIASLKV